MSYYQGDFWSGLGKGIKRIGRDIGRVAKAAAPIAGILLPAVGAATLVGRGVAAARKVKEAGRVAREVARTMTPAEISMPVPPPAVVHGMVPVPGYDARAKTIPQIYSEQWSSAGAQLTPQGVPIMPAPGSPSTTTAAKRTRRARTAYRRRKAAPKRRRATTRRRRRRTTRRRSY